MTRTRTNSGRALLLGVALFLAPVSASATPPTLAPPRLVEAPEPVYPPEARAAGVEGTTVLRLTIGVDGRVSAAEVIEAAGHGFDEAALALAPQLRFEPATRDGTPIPARIPFPVSFRLPREPGPGEEGSAPSADGAQVAGAAAESLAPEAETSGSPGGSSSRGPGAATSVPEPAGAVAGEGPALRASVLPAGEEPLEVTIRGESEATRLRRSARAVKVVETTEARREAADLGEVLARTEGVAVRRDGGLGSSARFSLDGFGGDQVRFFLDGIPLELSGYPFGLANVPVNLVERVEVYRGVVPVALGADALGGAVNLVSERLASGTHGSASYQAGSFGTHRVTAGAGHRTDSGLVLRAAGFFDDAANDYPVDVEVVDERGRPAPARVDRFHDAYRAAGGNLEAGFVDRPWARRLLLRAFVTDFDKELQHNPVMTVPYGDAAYGRTSAGASLLFERDVAETVELSAVAGYVHGRATFRDVGPCGYNWLGECIGPRDAEIGTRPRDERWREHHLYGRLNLVWAPRANHALRLSLAPTFLTRTADDVRLGGEIRDPLEAERGYLTLVSGMEYEVRLFDGRLENIVFVKDYLQSLDAEEPHVAGGFVRRDREVHRAGLGNSLRYRFADGLYGKASYEWATRLPRPDEVFGDGVLTEANLDLAPETSHNLNLGLAVEGRIGRAGRFRGEVGGILREADRLIVLLGSDLVLKHQNVFSARALGAEAAAGWTSPGDRFSLLGNATYLDFRNVSDEGTFAPQRGDRLPNQPYLFANAAARLRFDEVAAAGDGLSFSWNTRFVGEFFRRWESEGLTSSKQVIPAQLVHSLAAVYLVPTALADVSVTAEAQNLTDERAYDTFGAQRPGRAFYVKTTATF